MIRELNKIRDFFTIIAWNIYIGTARDAARDAVEEFKKLLNPEIIVLMEATNLYEDMDRLGYEVVQLKPRSLRPGSRPGQANIAILVRKDILIKKRGALHMKQFWRGPKHGWDQDPRVYRWVKVKDPNSGKPVKVAGAHVPFGEAARSETVRRLITWFRNIRPGMATILVLDANMRRKEFKDRVGDPAEAKVTEGHRIDLAAYKNCKLADKQNLGRGPSDHPAIAYDYEIV